MKAKPILNAALAFAMSALLVLSGCGGASTDSQTTSEETGAVSDDAAAFEDLTMEIFRYIAGSSAMNLHYMVADPSQYGINVPDNGFSEIDLSFNTEDYQKEEDWSKRLKAIDRSALDAGGQLEYDTLENVLDLDLKYYTEDMFFFDEPLGNVTGAYNNLPTLMAQYAFYSKDDVTEYIKILNQVPDYFGQIEEYEKKKSDAGMFMSDTRVDDIVDSCESFIENPDSNMLIEVFPDKLEDLNLSDSEIQDFTQQNEDAVKNSVIPAYESLIDTLTGLKGTGKNDGGICNFEGGKEYYSYLAKEETGTDMTPEEMEAQLQQALKDIFNEFSAMSKSGIDLSQLFNSDVDIAGGDTDKMISMLQSAIKEDFPEAADYDYEIKTVPESLQESTNPAFYITPPIDKPDQNVIYLNPSYTSDNELYTFTVLAHEGWPGHLYQQTYFNSTDPDPLRYALNFDGFTEGWASYVEYLSYDWAGLDENYAKLMKLENQVSLYLYALSDIGVNYEGWTEDDLATTLSLYGLSDSSAAGEIYDLVIGEPASYLPYAIGLLQFNSLEQQAEEKAGSSFDKKEFHRYILETGSVPFTVLTDHMKEDGII